MKLPRDLSGGAVARLLERHYGYRVARTKGSHMTLELAVSGRVHHVTVPRHADIRVGTLNAIIADVAEFHFVTSRDVRDTLFG